MATRTKKPARKPAETEPADEEQPATNGSRRNVQPRISITIDQSTRKNIRIAAALADKEVGEWCVLTLNAAAKKQISQDEAE